MLYEAMLIIFYVNNLNKRSFLINKLFKNKMGHKFAKTTIPYYDIVETIIYDMTDCDTYILFKTALNEPLILFYNNKRYYQICQHIKLNHQQQFEVNNYEGF